MRFSLWPLQPQSWSDLLAAVRHADRTGWDGAWIADHFMGDGTQFGRPETPVWEATAAIAALLASTEHVRIGSLVLGATYRHPAVLANWAATADQLSAGRLVLGLGAGWQLNEHRQYGIELPPVGARVDRFAEYCQVVRRLLTEERTSFDGRFFQLDEARCEPKPVQDPLPLLIGGKGDRMLDITARWADQWNMWALPPLLARRSAALDAACETIDRDPATIGRSTQALVLLTDDAKAAAAFVDGVAPRAAFAGTAEQFVELVGQWEAAGVDEVIVPDVALGRGNRRLEAMDALLAAVRSVS